MNVADAGTQEEGQVNGGAWDFVAHQVEDEGAGRAFANHRDRDVGSAGAFEEVGDGGRVHAFGRLAVDGEDLVAGADAGLIRGRAFEGVEDDDLGFTVGGGLGLDGHANAVIFAVLVFAHLGEGLWIVEVGVWIEDVEHARDGSVVDGLVGLIGVERFGVVLFDQGVDAGEGMERVAEG